MFGNLEKAERQWQRRRLFGPRRRGAGWIGWLTLVALAGGALLLWQERALAWLEALLE